MADLHIHTTASIFDGLRTPEEVVSLASANGVKSIAITDHSSVKGIDRAIKAGAELGVEVIPGVEILATYQGRPIHLTGLFIDHTDPSLAAFLSSLEAMHGVNNQLMIGVLVGMGFPLTIEQIAHLVELNTASARYFIPYLTEQGLIDPADEARKQEVMDKLKIPNYYKHKRFGAKEIIAYIRRAGGLAMLAHPLLYGMSWEEIDTALATLRSFGLNGMEVYYYRHTDAEISKLLELARKHGLLQSGGSDFHGYKNHDDTGVVDDRYGGSLLSLYRTNQKPHICTDIGKGLYGGSLVPDEALEEMKQQIK